MKYLALDPASTKNLGIAILENNAVSTQLLILTGKNTGESLVQCYNALRIILKETGASCVVVEQSIGFGFAPARAHLNQFVGVILLVASQMGLPVIELSPKHVKKVFTGNGNAKKPEVIKKARELFQLEKISEHEADAIALAWVAEKEEVSTRI